MYAGVILAAGKGKRFQTTDKNKVAFEYLDKPLVLYGVDLFEDACEKIYVVVGYAKESVIEVLKDKNVIFVEQQKALGTGDSMKKAIEQMAQDKFSPELVFAGYGDHMMFYDKNVLDDLIMLHKKTFAALTMVTTKHSAPDKLEWGRVIRNSDLSIQKIIEHKDTTYRERKIKELNAGLYVFDFKFLEEEVANINKSSVTGEYYLTELIDIAIKKGLIVSGLKVPFEKVGIGINTREEIAESEKLYREK